jgi:alpha-beta hydrolase superfamily lysophospholipase
MMDDRETSRTFSSLDGLNLFCREYITDQERARLIIVHGLGEHSGRYRRVVEHLFPTGISMWVPDLRGHGRSSGRRGHVERFDQYLDDVKTVVDRARQDKPGQRKIFLLGHSMGGLIAIRFAQEYPDLIDGLAVSSPALGMIIEIPLMKFVMAKLMSILRPGLQLSNELNVEKISHDPEVVEAYREDILVHNKISARWSTEFLKNMEFARQNMSNLSMPVLFQVAGDDHLVNGLVSKRVFNDIAGRDKTLHDYEGFYHENYNETADRRQRALSDLADWLDRHI